MTGQSQGAAALRRNVRKETWLTRRYRRAWRNLQSIWVVWQVLLLAGVAGAIALWTMLPDGTMAQSTATISFALLILIGACWLQSVILIRARRRPELQSPARGAILLFVLLLLWLAANAGFSWTIERALRGPHGSLAADLLWWLPRLLSALLLLPFGIEGAAFAARSSWMDSPPRILQLSDYWFSLLLPPALTTIITELLFAWRPSGEPRYLFVLGIGKIFVIATLQVCCVCLEIALAGTFLRDQERKNDALASFRLR